MIYFLIVLWLLIGWASACLTFRGINKKVFGISEISEEDIFHIVLLSFGGILTAISCIIFCFSELR